ncbi:MAG: hypothetical protein ACOYNZ_15375 [Rhodoferax sp.]
MSYYDYLTFAVSNIDADVPDHLLPNTLSDGAAMAARLSSDMVGVWA